MSDPASEIEVRVLVALTYSMPADDAERERIYGSSDLRECVSIDLDNDAAMVFLDSGYEVLDVSPSGSQDGGS